MTSIPDKAYWPLDYDWSRRGGRWDVHTDVLLLADAGHDPACAQAEESFFRSAISVSSAAR